MKTEPRNQASPHQKKNPGGEGEVEGSSSFAGTIQKGRGTGKQVKLKKTRGQSVGGSHWEGGRDRDPGRGTGKEKCPAHLLGD